MLACSVPDLPTFDPNDVALLITAVEQALERLYRANADLGGNDPEMLEYGRRYSLLLDKLHAIGG